MAVRKLCLRLNDENPLQDKALTKIEASGQNIQGYLLAAVLAYEHNHLEGLPDTDIDKIVDRIILRLSQIGKEISSAVQETPFRQEDLQIDEPNNEANDNLVPDSISGFLSGL